LNSYATGAVTTGNSCGTYCVSNAGGLVGGTSFGSIQQPYATGAVSAGYNAHDGGLVGELTDASVDSSYSSGPVQAGTTSEAGGLVGYRSFGQGYGAPITASYSMGAVSGDIAGGLIGYDQLSSAGSLSFDYWDLDTSGISDPSRGAGNVANDPGITGLSDAQLKSGLPSGFDPSIWAENPSINGGLPYLLANPPP
jgi:hypothetical protein